MLLMASGRDELLIVQTRDGNSGSLELLQLMAQRPRADPEAFGGQFAAAAGQRQGREDQLALALLEVMAESRFLRRRRRSDPRNSARVEVARVDTAAGSEPCGPLHDVGQLARIARPVMLQQLAFGGGRQAPRR